MSITHLRRWCAGVVALVAVGAVAGLAATPAQAAVPDRSGFVLFNGSTTVPSGTNPAATTVAIGSPGRYRVDFPGEGAPGGVVHVTAIGPVAHFCDIDAFGVSGIDEIAFISCYRAGGVPDPSAFSATFASSSGPPPTALGRFGYVDSQASGAIVSQYNTSGLANAVAHTAVGQWIINLPGLGTPGPLDGGLLATAVSPGVPAHCKIAKWASSPSGQVAQVFCFNAAGALFDTRFTLTFQFQRSILGNALPPKFYGSLFATPALGPPTTNFNSVVGFGANTLTHVATGINLVQFPQLVGLPDDVQVTAFGPTSDFCGLTAPWQVIPPNLFVPYVNCFTNAGVAIDSGFLVAATAAV